MARFLPALILAAAAFIPAAAQADLITNGSFTTGCANNYCEYSAGSSAITGWTIGGDSVDLINTYWAAPPSGGFSVDLDGVHPGSLSQSIATVIGQTYTLSFYMAGNPDGGAAVKSLDVSLGDTGVTNFTFDTTGKSAANMGWTLMTATFVADATSTLLSFTSADDQSSPWGPAIGGVTLEAVPEPETLALFGIGGLMAFGAMRGRKSKAAKKA